MYSSKESLTLLDYSSKFLPIEFPIFADKYNQKRFEIMKLIDLIAKGYFPKEIPPPFTSALFAAKCNQIRKEWSSVFMLNTDISRSDFPVKKKPNESSTGFKKRKRQHQFTFTTKYQCSKSAFYSISKGNISRRFLQLPNPHHFLELGRAVVDNWGKFKAVYRLSNYSKSVPIIDPTRPNRAVATISKGVAEFRNDLLETSSDCNHPVK